MKRVFIAITVLSIPLSLAASVQKGLPFVIGTVAMLAGQWLITQRRPRAAYMICISIMILIFTAVGFFNHGSILSAGPFTATRFDGDLAGAK